MSLKKLNLKHSYSKGYNNDIIEDFLVPALSMAKNYYRSVGYFSCSSLLKTTRGIENIVCKNGKIKIITSPNLSKEDIEKINKGYKSRKEIIENAIINQINSENLIEFSYNSDLIIELIENSILDIKIVFGKNYTLYHDKVGFIMDENDNTICFVGSPNETFAAYSSNYEKVRLYKSWVDKTSKNIIKEEMEEFEQIWNNQHDYLETLKFSDSLKKGLIKALKQTTKKPRNDIKLRSYQLEAISNWINNGFKGFYEMATGTGKTFTAIYSIKELLNRVSALYTIIVCPYRHLVEQWYEELNIVLPEITKIRVYSDYPKWENKLRITVNNSKYLKSNSDIIVLTTKSSYRLERFRKHIKKLENRKLLVVDEAHRFYNEVSKTDLTYQYVLGLSATPYFKDLDRTKELINYFDKIVFKYTLEEAIGEYLVEYNYENYIVHLTDIEQEDFMKAQSRIASCFKNGILVKDIKTLGNYIRQRNRIIARSEEKQQLIPKIVNKIVPKDHFIIYCGDGHIDSEDGKEDIRYVDKLTRSLHTLNVRSHKFTATETIYERMELIDDFTSGMIDVMVAIKCLDEGVNIPSIKTALLLANNDDSREFIQRRGRILRKFKDKEIATIIDIIVLPASSNAQKVAEIELRRFHEFARLAKNKADVMPILNKLLIHYNLDLEDIIINNNIDEIWGDNDE
jgi:superfamily II DNA or RNA helicase